MVQMLIQEDPRLRRRRGLAESMMQQGLSQRPIQHWTQGVNQLAQTLLGAHLTKKADKEQEDRSSQTRKALANVLSGQGDFDSKMQQLSQVPNVNQDMLMQMQLQRASQPKARDPIADYEAKRKIDQQYGGGQSDLDRLIKMMTLEKMEAQNKKLRDEEKRANQDLAGQGATAKQFESMLFETDDQGNIVRGEDNEPKINETFADAVGPAQGLMNWISSKLGSTSEPVLKFEQAGRAAKSAVISNAKKLGANPTDRDVKLLMDTIPGRFQDEKHWSTWYTQEYLPGLEAIAQSRGKDIEGQNLSATERTVKRRGMHKGRPVVEYSDGTVEYDD